MNTSACSCFFFRLDTSASVIFWTLFGEIERDSFRIKEKGYDVIWRTGMTLFGAFNVVAVLVALNMLIAILNESYTRITVSANACLSVEFILGKFKNTFKPVKRTKYFRLLERSQYILNAFQS